MENKEFPELEQTLPGAEVISVPVPENTPAGEQPPVVDYFADILPDQSVTEEAPAQEDAAEEAPKTPPTLRDLPPRLKTLYRRSTICPASPQCVTALPRR